MSTDAARRDLAGKRVLVAMSGGVDSSVAAALLAERGAEVVGATYKNFCFTDSDELPGRSCCSVDAVADALAVCRHLGIEHRVVDETERFTAEVVENFEAEYANGRTPNPCVRCNSEVRFPRLIEEAVSDGFDYVATGHYARLVEEDGTLHLARGLDASKDQSYFLAALRPESYSRLLFPLGDLDKSETRALARRAGLHVHEKRESQDVCFLAGGTLRDYLDDRGLLRPGTIVDGAGKVLGEHPGAALYTVGQRHGLGVAAGRPVYVTAIDIEAGTVTVGEESDLAAREIVGFGGWVHPTLLAGLERAPLQARIRYRHAGAAVDRWRLDANGLVVSLAEPVKAAAPGQSLVLYADDRVVAFAVIDSARS